MLTFNGIFVIVSSMKDSIICRIIKSALLFHIFLSHVRNILILILTFCFHWSLQCIHQKSPALSGFHLGHVKKGLKSLWPNWRKQRLNLNSNHDQWPFDIPQLHHTDQQIDGGHFHLNCGLRLLLLAWSVSITVWVLSKKCLFFNTIAAAASWSFFISTDFSLSTWCNCSIIR